jgi:hypothetical protein
MLVKRALKLAIRDEGTIQRLLKPCPDAKVTENPSALKPFEGKASTQ